MRTVASVARQCQDTVKVIWKNCGDFRTPYWAWTRDVWRGGGGKHRRVVRVLELGETHARMVATCIHVVRGRPSSQR
jgi:hypothetical protein